MKRILAIGIVFGVAIFAALLGRAGAAAQAATAEAEIRAIETLKLQYPLEPARWEKNVHAAAVFTQGSGKVISKAELLRNYQNEGRTIKNSLEMTEPQFTQFGDTAVFSYLYTRARQDGAFEIRQHLRRTAVYQRTSSHWLLVASTTIGIHNADRQQRPVDPKILDTYVGLYEGKLRITRDGMRIMAQDPSDKQPVELLAVTNDAFAVAGEADSLLFVFEKGPDGRIRIRAHNIGGSEAVIKRVND